MVNICSRLRPECILIDPEERDRELIIGKMVERIAMIHPIENPHQLIQDILKRESLCPTDIGLGCAIPHAHSAALDTTLVAAARISPPLENSGPEKTPVSLIFLLVGPQNKATLHLKLLSKLARLLHDEAFRNQLNAVHDAKEFHELVCRKEE